MGGHFLALVCILGVVSGSNLLPHQRDYHVSDYIVRSVMNEASTDHSLQRTLKDYLGTPEISSGLDAIPTSVIKPLSTAEITDPKSAIDGLNDNPPPSTGNGEHLQDSSLCDRQFVAGAAGEGEQWFKSDPSLPAYCISLDPCSVPYTVEEGCMEDFENTATFSPDFQHSHECMCDCEYIIQCSDTNHPSGNNDYNNNMFLDEVTEELSGNKYHFEKNNKPFLLGDRLPEAR